MFYKCWFFNLSKKSIIYGENVLKFFSVKGKKGSVIPNKKILKYN
ncbi:hypothetical protein GGR21_000689 [Dysgonomonas hofstadii]|uniref:Uncharacterized protein n=1 Tax=Dysgonomonas hofstadii TaxID=637886 RepID=A0A840CQF7_9BACT|nr:hypothetical protein [Dysgonomonas hofstadii]